MNKIHPTEGKVGTDGDDKQVIYFYTALKNCALLELSSKYSLQKFVAQWSQTSDIYVYD